VLGKPAGPPPADDGKPAADVVFAPGSDKVVP
jgi:hypothetical protein